MFTGDDSKAGTDANVYIQIFGECGDTGYRKLMGSTTNSNKFERGNVSSSIIIRAVTCDFQQCGSLTSIDSDEPVQPPVKVRS